MAVKQGDKRKTSNRRDRPKPPFPIKGVVVAKKCKCCQHHEIGIKTRKGYIPLKPGMKIVVIEE